MPTADVVTFLRDGRWWVMIDGEAEPKSSHVSRDEAILAGNELARSSESLHIVVEYRPRGYAVQADLGAVTGGQASLYRRLVSGHSSDEAQYQRDLESLYVYDALALGLKRRREIFEIIERSADPEEAVAAVQDLLGLDDQHPARAILDLQLRRLTVRDRNRIAEERDQLRIRVAAGRPNG